MEIIESEKSNKNITIHMGHKYSSMESTWSLAMEQLLYKNFESLISKDSDRKLKRS